MGPIKMGLLGVAAIVGVAATGSIIGIVTAPFRATSGVINRTLDADNVIRTYELFHDRWTGFEARIRQVQDTQATLNSETNQSEKVRLRIDLGAQRQSCRDIAAAYNADVQKTNRDIFRGRSAPQELDMNRC